MHGFLIGVLTFILIGLFHPLVIKGEYYFGQKVNYAFAAGAMLFAFLSFCLKNYDLEVISAIIACCCLWSIKEVKDQEKRVLKGHFKENPKRKTYYDLLRNKNESDNH